MNERKNDKDDLAHIQDPKTKVKIREKKEKAKITYWDRVIKERTKQEKELNKGGFYDPFDD